MSPSGLGGFFTTLYELQTGYNVSIQESSLYLRSDDQVLLAPKWRVNKALLEPQ